MTIGGFVWPSVGDPQERYLRFLVQLGVTDVVGSGQSHPRLGELMDPQVALSPACRWLPSDIVELRERCEAAGLAMIAIENPLPPSCWDQIILGTPDRDRQIDNVIATVRAAGEGGISILGYNWMVNPPGLWRFSTRTTTTYPARGGAETDLLDMAELEKAPLFRDREYGAEEMWENY